jgi:hypothetical protein
MAARADAEGVAEVEYLLVAHPELAGEFVDPYVRRHLAGSALSLLSGGSRSAQHVVTHRLDVGSRDRRSECPGEGPTPHGGIEALG